MWLIGGSYRFVPPYPGDKVACFKLEELGSLCASNVFKDTIRFTLLFWEEWLCILYNVVYIHEIQTVTYSVSQLIKKSPIQLKCDVCQT